MSRTDVVVAGAGIGGAVLALALGTRGRRVAIVERESAPPVIARPEVLWGATPRALERYGIADSIRRTASVQLEGIDIGGAKPWLRVTRDDFAAAGVDAFSTNPTITRLSDGVPAAAFIPWPGNEGVLLVPLPADRARRLFDRPPEHFWSARERVTPMAGALREHLEFPRDFRRVARPFGHAPSYVANGAALIGDAAHPMTPAGGQGANASIWDALALADVADAALRAGDVSRERLLAYERLRRPVNAQSVSFSRAARRAFRAGGVLPLALVLPSIMKTIQALGWPKRRGIRSFATAFVHPSAN